MTGPTADLALGCSVLAVVCMAIGWWCMRRAHKLDGTVGALLLAALFLAAVAVLLVH